MTFMMCTFLILYFPVYVELRDFKFEVIEVRPLRIPTNANISKLRHIAKQVWELELKHSSAIRLKLYAPGTSTFSTQPLSSDGAIMFNTTEDKPYILISPDVVFEWTGIVVSPNLDQLSFIFFSCC